MMKRRRRERPDAPYLLLAAFILGVHGVVLWSDRLPPGDPAPCEGIPVELAGDVPLPGVYLFRSALELRSFLTVQGWPAAPEGRPTPEEIFSCPGARVLMERSANGIRASVSEMTAFFKVTLGLPISLNRESEEGLTAIPGVGPRIARAIVAERDSREGFRSLDELLSVQGIGLSLYTRIRPYLIL